MAARLRRRYPPPLIPRPVIAVATAVAAAALLAWLVWAGWVQSRPVASAQVITYSVRSDSQIDITVTVDRPDPGVPVNCRVIAQAFDFTTVGEQDVRVAPSRYEVVNVRVTLTTIQRAVSASTKGCRP